jgi:hypothetical protein
LGYHRFEDICDKEHSKEWSYYSIINNNCQVVDYFMYSKFGTCDKQRALNYLKALPEKY